MTWEIVEVGVAKDLPKPHDYSVIYDALDALEVGHYIRVRCDTNEELRIVQSRITTGVNRSHRDYLVRSRAEGHDLIVIKEAKRG